MKKKYLNPTIESLSVNTLKMFAGSGNGPAPKSFTTGFSSTSGSGGSDALSKEATGLDW